MDEPALLQWPAARRVPTTITTEGATWRDPVAVHRLDAVVPPRLADLSLSLPAALNQRVVDAERALAQLDTQLGAADAASAEAATFALLRSESVSSSRIEGIRVTNRRLAEAIHDAGGARQLAREVVGNVDAMRAAVEYGASAEPFTPDAILDLHRRLMVHAIGVREGRWRTEQNWIGAERIDDGVAYVPPPPEYIDDLVDDLCDFVDRSPATAVVRAAIAHAQFEAIHPFVDGNGRVGRCLVSITLRKAGGTRTIPPVSSVLLRDTDGYFRALHQFQQNADPAPWIEHFADATVEACQRARALVDDIEALKERWADRLGSVRRGTHLARLLDVLPTMTIASADQIADRLGVDPNVARRLIAQLVGAGIAKQTSASRRNRVWRVDDMLRLLDDHALGRR